MKVFPINTLLPKQDVIHDVVSLGSGKLPEHILIEKANKSEFSYLRIVKPQYINPNLQAGSDEFYQFSFNHFQKLIQSNFVKRCANAIFYYEQLHHSGVSLGGWIMGVDGDDYLEGKVKRHENTITAKENRLVKHIQVLNSMAEPVLLSQILPSTLMEASMNIKVNMPDLVVLDEYQNTHQVWIIQDQIIQGEILQEFNKLDSLYIADGHHRVAGSSRYLVNEFGHNSGKGFMALIMNEDDLLIKPFYRIVKTQLSMPELVTFLINSGLQVTSVDINNLTDYKSIPYRHSICFNHDSAILIKLPEIEYGTAVDALDVTVAEKLIFGPAFGICDTAHDSNIRFQRGDMLISEMKGYLNKGEMAFLFHSNTMSEIRAVADEGAIMPPKSTFIEPKLLTGFIVETY